jgi:Uma2 family endonuclease
MATYPAMNQTSYTYEDYKAFPDEFRCEIIGGRIYDMTPAPSLKHQEIVLKLGRLLGDYLDTREHPCRVYIAPADVILAENDVVQPDVFVVCDQSKIRKEGLFGAPAVVFEVLSPSTAKKDRGKKMKLYRRFGVLECFLIDPESELVEKYVFSQGRIEFADSYEGEEVFSIDAIGLELTAKDLFV